MSSHNQSLHHFNIAVGSRDQAVSEIKKICTNTLNFVCDGNPNFYFHHFDSLLIDEARLFAETKNRKIKSGEVSVSIAAFSNATREAQNALLKLLEEPIPGNYIFFVVPEINIILPTVLSRATILKIETSQITTDANESAYSDIVKMSYKERLAMVETLLKKIKDEKVPKSEARELVQKILTEMNRRLLVGHIELARPIADIASSAQFINTPSASLKTILEHIMLTIPKSDIMKK